MVQLCKKSNQGECWRVSVRFKQKQFSNLAALNWLILKFAQGVAFTGSRSLPNPRPRRNPPGCGAMTLRQSMKSIRASLTLHPFFRKIHKLLTFSFSRTKSPIFEKTSSHPARAHRYVLPLKVEHTETGEAHRAGF